LSQPGDVAPGLQARPQESVVYAIIQSGGRQVKVTPGATVEVDHFAGEAGEEVSVTSVLFVAKDGGDIIAGAPFVSGARVVAVIEGESRGPKIRVFKKKRRKGFRKSRGHRSIYTRLLVKEIVI
jgi:large subunit ribosomal protein L21